MHTKSTLGLLIPSLLVACSDFGIGNVPDDNTPGACPLVVPLPPPDVIDETCGVVPEVPEPWSFREQWRYQGSVAGLENSSYAPPLVARLTDTNSDGIVDETDMPNVVLMTFPWDLIGANGQSTREGSVVVLNGSTGEEIWTRPGSYYAAGHALGDVTGDGIADVVTFDAGRRAILFDNAGNEVWRSIGSTQSPYPQATIADLDADGVPEIIADDMVIDSRDGTILFRLPIHPSIPYSTPTVADLDLDGKQEVIYGNVVTRADGTEAWRVTQYGDYGQFSAVLNLDDDDEAEVVVVTGDTMAYYDADGTQLARHPLDRDGSSAPCVGDFDGDGEPEIAIAGIARFGRAPSKLSVFNFDGTAVWVKLVHDVSGIAGCSGYDFDGDGAMELLYADEETLFMFDGRTGATHYQSAPGDHWSGTVFEYPVVADIDLDGHAEMLIVHSNDEQQPALTVFEHDGAGWAPSGTTWPIHDFAVSNVNPDDTIPSSPPLYWLEHNTYRTRPIIDFDPYDFQVTIVDACTEACADDALVRVGAQVVNVGPVLAPGDVYVTLYSETEAGRVALDTERLGVLTPGRVANVILEATVAQVGTGTLVARVDDIGTGSGRYPECNEDNNESVWGPIDCE